MADSEPTPGTLLRKVLLVGALALVAGVYLARAATEAAARNPSFFVDPARVAVEQAPAWLPAAWIEEARARLARVLPYSIFDPAGPADAETALRSIGWIAEVSSAGRSFPRTTRLRLRVRRPVAIVETKEGDVVVDAGGVALPPFPSEAAALLPPLPRVVVARASLGPSPGAGRAFRDRRVRDGAAAAVEVETLVARDGDARVVAIDVTDARGAADPLLSPIVLVTAGGARLRWGRPAAWGAFGELSSASKLEALARVEADHPGLEGVLAADLRFDRPVVYTGTLVADSR